VRPNKSTISKTDQKQKYDGIQNPITQKENGTYKLVLKLRGPKSKV